MLIEKTMDEIVIHFPLTEKMERIQDFMDYLRYKELTATYEHAQQDVDSLAREINKNWNSNSKHLF